MSSVFPFQFLNPASVPFRSYRAIIRIYFPFIHNVLVMIVADELTRGDYFVIVSTQETIQSVLKVAFGIYRVFVG